MLELHESDGIDALGAIKWDMGLCLLAVYIICYFSLWKGISTSGKVNDINYFFANNRKNAYQMKPFFLSLHFFTCVN